MEQKGLTKKQFWVQMAPFFLYAVMGIYWLIIGIVEGKTLHWVFGAVYLALVVAIIVTQVIKRRKHPVEDPELDEQVMTNFKDGMKGMGIVMGFITVGFLIAFGLAALLK